MKDELISLFIDDEMDLDEKVDFVSTVHQSSSFTDETLELLHQEKLLTADMVTQFPVVKDPVPLRSVIRWLRPVAVFSMVLVVFAVAWFHYDGSAIISGARSGVEPVAEIKIPHRFVIYRPEAGQTEIIGSFTNWQPIPMEHAGSSGYWTITIDLPEGEHRYSYRIEGGQQMADPTVRSRETDDYGGENSIIAVKRSI